MGRHSCCQKQKLKKGLWSPEEDEKLVHYITKYGHGCWSTVPKQAGLQRCGKSCRLRWINYLRPDLKRGIFSAEEEKLIIELHSALGNRWSQIATQLPGRTDNEIKNYWNTCIKKKLRQAGIDPNTHKPIADNAVESSSTMSSTSQQNNAAGDKTSSSSGQQQQQAVAPAGDSPASNGNKKPRMYPAVLEDILFSGRISESKAGLLPSSQQLQLQQHLERQQQQQQQGKQLTTDNLLEKFISSSMDKQQVSNLMPPASSSCTGSNGSTSSCLDFSASLRQQQQAEFSFPVPSCSNFSSPIFWVLSNAPSSGLEAPPTSTQFGVDLPSSGIYGESSSFMGALRPGNNTSSSSSPLVSASMDRYWDTTGSSRWNYSHKLESSDGSCESLSLESPAQRWADLLPATSSCGMQELDHHHHHHHHHQQQLNGSSKFLGADAQQVVVSWPSATSTTTTTTTTSSMGDLSAYGSIMSPELQRLSAVIDQIM